MSDDIISATLRDVIQQGFGTAMPGVPMLFDNLEYKQPTGHHIEVVISPSATLRENIGDSRKFCKHGTINIRCFAPVGAGTRQITLYTDALETILLDKQIPAAPIGHITVYGADTRNRGTLNGFYLRTIQFAYKANIVK